MGGYYFISYIWAKRNEGKFLTVDEIKYGMRAMSDEIAALNRLDKTPPEEGQGGYAERVKGTRLALIRAAQILLNLEVPEGLTQRFHQASVIPGCTNLATWADVIGNTRRHFFGLLEP